MQNKELIYIGKRSKLLKSLYPFLPKGEIISFNKAFNLHLENELQDKKLILFSIPEENMIKNYFNFIKEVNCRSLINISSTCIYAKALYKDKFFNKLPNYLFVKSKAHKLVTERENSKNCIVGILNKQEPFPSYPYSEIKLIANDLKNLIENFNFIKENNFYSFKIISPNLNSLRFIPYYLRISIRNLPLGIPLFLDFFYKVIKLKARNYTCLSCFHFIDNLRIGDGTFGTAASSNNDVIFFSGRNTFQSSENVLNTLIGYEKIGLDKYRHGVSTFYKNGSILKKWVFTPRIRKVFRKAYNFHVLAIKWKEECNFFEIIAKKGSEEFTFFANSLKLAAGTLENIRLCNTIARDFEVNKIKLSDHFITCIGDVEFGEILKNKYFLKTCIPFIFLRNNLIPLYEKKKLIGFAEFRIDTKSKTKLFGLLKKISSYIFNRTGILIFTPSSCEIWVQLLIEDLLRIKFEDKFKESLTLINSIHPSTNKIRDNLVNCSTIQVSDRLTTFREQTNQHLPAHHLWGGSQMLEHILIDKLIEKGKLNICGSPSILKLGPFHHTIRNAKIIKSKFNKKI